MEDAEIIELYIQRDEAAITETDVRYGKSCRRTAYHILADLEDSEECVSDSYFAAWNAIPPTMPTRFGAYLIGIVRRLSLMRVREKCADRRGGGEYALAFDELEESIGAANSPEKDVELRELAEAINAFLRRLSRDDRRIFLCRYYLCVPIREIARAQGFSESKIKSSLHRSRTKLRKHLIGEGLL